MSERKKIPWEWILWGVLASYVLTLHAVFIRVVPDPIFEPDSVSYIEGAFNLIFKNQFLLSTERTPGYPLFLASLLKLFHSFRAVLICQHLLVIASGIIAGILCVRHLGCSRRRGIAVALLTTSLPHILIRSHSIMTETLFTFLVILSIGTFLSALNSGSRWQWGFCGLATACALLVRPVGWALVLSLAIAWIFHPQRRRKPWAALPALAVLGGIVLSYSAYNYHRYKFFGIDQISGLALIGPSARYLELAQLENGPVRDALEPLYRDPVRRDLLEDDEWVRYGTNGVVNQLSPVMDSPVALNKTLTKIFFKGVMAHPALFAGNQLKRWANFLIYRSTIPALYLQPEFAVMVYRGMLIFEQLCRSFPEACRLTVYQANDFHDYYEQLQLLKRLPDREAERVLANLTPPDAYRYDTVLALERPLQPLGYMLRWMPLISIFLSWNLLRGRQRFVVLLLLGFLNAHILLTNLGGDTSQRHAIPVEWIYWVLMVAGSASLLKKTSSDEQI